jgi:hypothetical protein
MNAKPQRRTPEPETFAQKKRKAEETFMSSIVDSNKAIAGIASSVASALAGPSTPSAAPNIVQDPVLGAIQFALVSVPQHKKMACMMDVLKLITDKYADCGS